MNSEKNCFPNRYVHAPDELPSEFKQTQIQGYRQERFTMECIREGRPEQLNKLYGQKTFALLYDGDYAQTPSQIRQVLLTGILLASRAAITGGVDISSSFQFYYNTVSAMHGAQTPEELWEIASACMLHYAREVQRIKGAQHYRSTTGRTIKESIMETKCATAKILLKTTEMPISSISVSLGFSSQNHFQQVFKKMTGKTPRQFRKN